MEYNKVYCDNSDLLLPKMQKAGMAFDLILTDPPYNINKDFGNNSDKLSISDFLEISKKRINLCKNLLTENGSLIWFGIHKYIGFSQVIMYEAGLHYRRMNIWHYENGFSRVKTTPATQYEPFLWFSKSDSSWTYNYDDVRVPYKSAERIKNPVYYKGANGERKEWRPHPLGALRGDVWDYPTLAGKLYQGERTGHPTQKPESLISDIIKAFCPKSEDGKYQGRILDPFHGSGTLGVCCEKLNQLGHQIQWIGIELEDNWCSVANERLQNI